MIYALIFAGIMNFVSYWFSDKIVLAMYGAREIGPDHRHYRIVERLAGRASLPMPDASASSIAA
jgi:heat shock protein HtpX